VLEKAATEWARLPADEWGAAYGRVIDDLRGALAWAAQDSTDRSLRIRLTVAGLLLWNNFSLTEECRVHVSQAVEDLDAANLAGTAFEMHLKVWLGASSMFTHGLQPMAMEAMRWALEIAIQIGDTSCHLRCLRTIGMFQHLIGEHAAGLQTFEAFAALAAATDSPTAPEGEFQLSTSECFLGRLPSARKRLERLRENAGDARRQTVRYQSDIYVDIGCALTIAEWLTGSPDAATRTAKANIERALAANHHMSLNNALNAACPVFYWSGNFDECSLGIAMLDEEGRQHGIVTRRPIARFYRAALMCARNGLADGIEGLERAIAEFRAINHLARMPYYLGVLADAQAKWGRLDEARTTIQTALDLAHANSEEWCLPEVQRVHASILTAGGEEQKAEAVLLDSMTLAQKSGALSWRLRAATDLARSWSRASRAEEARNLLSPIYSEFREGHETPDLAAAGQLLASLKRRLER
jgi:tetratricopeptide (TPR) repeat protein